MTARALRNVANSVRDRLLNLSQQRGEDFLFVLHRYAAERFLYRLGASPHRDRFVLKGAMLYALWGGSSYRPTRDLDFTGYGSPDTALECLREICAVHIEDGLVFDATTLDVKPIRDEDEYGGWRVRCQATLGSARISMQIDVGFGNAIEPPANDVAYPTLLNDLPAPNIRAYPYEAVVAEKLHALVFFGERTSRLKDIYDLYTLAGQFAFDAERLARSVAATFERRGTPIAEATPVALTSRFFADEARARQWRAYLDRNRLPGAPADLTQVGERIIAVLAPVWEALAFDASPRRPGNPEERQ